MRRATLESEEDWTAEWSTFRHQSDHRPPAPPSASERGKLLFRRWGGEGGGTQTRTGLLDTDGSVDLENKRAGAAAVLALPGGGPDPLQAPPRIAWAIGKGPHS